MKLLKVLSLILIIGFVSCEKTKQPITERDLRGKCIESSKVLGVRVCFYSNDNKGNYYRAYVGDEPRDFYLHCGGEGRWKVENNTIILGSNSSNCANIRSVAGRYPQ